jgi:hypothetical protein
MKAKCIINFLEIIHVNNANKIARADCQRNLLEQAAGFFNLTFDNPTVLQDIRLGLMSYDNASHETKNNVASWSPNLHSKDLRLLPWVLLSHQARLSGDI